MIPLPPDSVPPGLREKVERMERDVNEMMETIERVKGEPFADAVRSMLTASQMARLLQISGAPPILQEIHGKLTAQLVGATLKALGQVDNVEEISANVEALMHRMEGMQPS